MNFPRLIFSVFFLIAASKGIAQGGATIKATVDKNKILIGEPFSLTIEAYLSPESVISFVNIDSIEHFEFLEKPLIDSVTQAGSTTFKGVYKLTSFDSGHWVIPSFVLSPGVMTDSIPIDVVFSEFDSNQDYHDIKDIIEIKPPKGKQWWMYAVGGALLLLLTILYFFRKKKPVPAVQQIAAGINPYEEAMKELEQLRKSNPGVKEFHSRLTNIFRLYIYRKKGILSLQKTTDDLVLQLKGLQLEKEQFNKLAQALRLSDFVKFAKYVPSEEDNSSCLEEIKQSIMTIEKSETEVLPSGRI